MDSERELTHFKAHPIKCLHLVESAIRDALVEKIWEGTITVLSLDIMRATSKPGVLRAFMTVGFSLTIYVTSLTP